MFITLEGGEGAGKSTQALLLADALIAAGVQTCMTREPGGTPNAEALRSLLLDRNRAWTVQAEVLLHFAARTEHLAAAICPALTGGKVVVCDRFADSTMAYQGHGLGADRSIIAKLTKMLPVTPDLTVVLDVSADTAARRIASRRQALDRYEAMDPEFHARVRRGFLDIARSAQERCVVVAADADPGVVHHKIWRVVQARMAGAT